MNLIVPGVLLIWKSIIKRTSIILYRFILYSADDQTIRIIRSSKIVLNPFYMNNWMLIRNFS
jgi:hypothetical protein